MANRRMFNKNILSSDQFSEMSHSSQILYVHLCLNADDKGFVYNPIGIYRVVGCNKEDLELLIKKKFIYIFDTGKLIILHWYVHNEIKNYSNSTTLNTHEMSLVILNQDNIYQLSEDCVQDCAQNGSKIDTQYSIGKNSEVKKINSYKGVSKEFVIPALDEVKQHCIEKNLVIDYIKWYKHYDSNNWMTTKGPMNNWKKSINAWISSEMRNDKFTKKTNEPEWFNDYLHELVKM